MNQRKILFSWGYDEISQVIPSPSNIKVMSFCFCFFVFFRSFFAPSLDSLADTLLAELRSLSFGSLILRSLAELLLAH